MEYLFPILFIAIIFAIRVMNKKLQENQKTESFSGTYNNDWSFSIFQYNGTAV